MGETPEPTTSELPLGQTGEQKVGEVFINGFYHGPNGDLPVDVIGEPQPGQSGKMHVEVKWYAGQNLEETGTSFVPVDDLIMGGELVKIRRDDGTEDDGWVVAELFPEVNKARVTKEVPGGHPIEKDVSWYDLWSWQPPESGPPADIAQPVAEKPPDTSESPADSEFQSTVLSELKERQSAAETKISQLENLLNSGKTKAKEAIDSNDFQKAANYVQESANRRSRLNKVQANLKDIEKKVKLTEDLLKPANILDLKEKFDRSLAQEKERRDRLHDDQPLDSYAEMLRRYLVDEYAQTGAKEGQRRHIPDDLRAEIEALMNKSFEELESSLPKTEMPQRPENPAPDATEPIPDEKKRFGYKQRVFFEQNGRLKRGWTVAGYGRRPTSRRIEVNIISPDGRTDAWVEQDALIRMQSDEAVDSPDVAGPAGQNDLESGNSAVESENTSSGAPFVPEVLPAELSSSEIPAVVGTYNRWIGGESTDFWSQLFRPNWREVQARWGNRARNIRNVGRMILGRRPNPDESAENKA